jgi:hypothetical protein
MNNSLKFFIYAFFWIFGELSFAQSQYCAENISQLNQDLQSILRKIPAMPPLTQIYTLLKNSYEDTKLARDTGNYRKCIEITDKALNFSSKYAH